MAYEARLSDFARGGYAVEDIQEGRAVKLSTSGGHNDLPHIITATAGDVHNVFILFVPPDNFSRPTDANLYKANYLTIYNGRSGFSEPIQTTTVYNTGKSTLWNPTVESGELALVKRGGSYAVPSGAFIDSAGIRVPGAMIKVGANGRWEVTTTSAEAVGIVEEYNTTNEVLIFMLHH